jgi:chaperonin GroEL
VSADTFSAFFSYSRKDMDFVLRLAADLKAAGAPVWVDQLDIEPGTHWDREVQNALNNCPRMLVILSPAAVDSVNVLDEMARGLRKRKAIIPVLYLDCDVPLQLERLHYIDFRTDYAAGFKALLKALGAESPAKGIKEQRLPLGEPVPREEQADVSGQEVATKSTQVPSLLLGLQDLVDDIRIAFGPNGQNVPVTSNEGPALTRDFATIAKGHNPQEQLQKMVVDLVREAGLYTRKTTGDGAKTTVLLAESIIRQAIEAIGAGHDAIRIKRGIEVAAESLCGGINNDKRTPGILDRFQQRGSGEMIAQVGTIAANNDATLGCLIVEAMKKVGRDGVITVEEATTMETRIEVVEGMQFDCGYLSPYFVTDPERMEAVLENAVILIHEKKISSMKCLLPLLEQVASGGRPLIIIAEEVEGEVLSTLVVNQLRETLRVAAVKAPGFGNHAKALLQDIAILTGGKAITEDLGIKLENVQMQDLGQAKKVTIDKDNTTIIESKGRVSDIEARVKEIRSQIEKTTNDYDRERLQERLVNLVIGVAVIKVGAVTETLMKERKARAEATLCAMRSAVREGIVPGGGLVLWHAGRSLGPLNTTQAEQVGVRILGRACEEILFQIIASAGRDATEEIGVIAAHRGVTFGFNAATGRVEDLVEAGVVEPVAVLRAGLRNAVSSAMTVLSVGKFLRPRTSLP